ncbi:MAG: hypothetical protein OEZ41_04010 [Nitrospirota bacterium]|nr:hypothetical protein [Nitrospirota bacterium]MDH5699108.1 hypothetical protein [Nitrospirota bacterium]
MNRLSGCSLGSIFALALGTWVLCMGLNPVAEAAPIITLEQSVHFLESDGSDVMVEAGTYEVETLVGSRLRLNVEGGDTLFLDAHATTHSEEIEAPLAVTVSGEDPDVVHIVLLLQNGQALDAPGSISGTRSRGFSNLLASTAQIQVAVAQQAPVVRDHRGQPKVLPPPRPPVAPTPGTIAPIVRDHRPPAPSNASDFELAFSHAPIHYQDTDNTNAQADYITRFDYDGNMVATDNWENLKRYPLMGHAYYSVVESCTHWFIVYGFFHPRDWTDSAADQEHENDLEGLLSIVRKDGSRFGKLEGMVTVYHNDFYSFTPSGSPLGNGRETVDGRLTLQPYEGSLRPLTVQQAKGHGLKAFPYTSDFHGKPNEDGIIYYPARTAGQVPKNGNDRHVNYGLVDIFSNGGLWEGQLAEAKQSSSATKIYHKWGTFKGNKGGGCGNGITVTCSENAAHLPWAWDDHDDDRVVVNGIVLSRIPSGELALDPAHLASVYFNGLGSFSQQYLKNRYLSDLRNRGFRQGNLPNGWPSQLNLDQLSAKLIPTCG